MKLPPASGRPTALAFGCSAVLFIACIGLLWWKWSQVGTLKLNEWGDFLAGIAAALAFIWLIAAHFQQREELKQNTAALMLQLEELNHQQRETGNLVEATTDLVKATMRHAEATEAAAVAARLERRPSFRHVSVHRVTKKPIEITVSNIGGPATLNGATSETENVEVQFDHGGRLCNGDQVRFVFLTSRPPYPDRIVFRVNYVDAAGHSGSLRLQFRTDNCGLSNIFTEIDGPSGE